MTLGGLALLCALAWAFLLTGAGMEPMDGMEGMAHAPGWPVVAGMWIAMMVAMMMPSAAPMVLLYARVHRHSVGTEPPPTASFLAGYLACWTAFSLVAAALHLSIAEPMTMVLHSRAIASGVLIAAGVYQLSPLKDACLRRCRSPAEFLTRHYRPGAGGAFRLGMIHGAYCVGCCWLLMALLFVGGVMNLAWIAGLTLLVAAEKLLSGGKWIAWIAGIALIGWGVARLV